MSNVSFVREELRKMRHRYKLVRDITHNLLKEEENQEIYLPRPHEDIAVDSLTYKSYITRAIPFDYTGRTIEGMTGQVFLREPDIKAPPELDQLLKDANGANLNFGQLAKTAVRWIVSYGRMGIFTDYPHVGRSTTRQDILSGRVKPTINIYLPWNIINWRTQKIGTKHKLVLVVLRELVHEENNFEVKEREQFRVLRLTENEDAVATLEQEDRMQAVVEVWRDENVGDPSLNEDFKIQETYVLTDSNNQPLKELPFNFVGSESNDDTFDFPPVHAIAEINWGLYRNSADLEQSVFFIGQPTPWASGITKQWIDDVWGGTLCLGSNQFVPIPSGERAELLQAEPNNLVLMAMEQKEKAIVALGARLVQERRVERTATESEIENASETSILGTIARNVSMALTEALQSAAIYLGLEFQDISVKLNENFDLTSMSADEIRVVIESWMSGAILTEEMRDALDRHGLVKEVLETYLSKIEEDNKLVKKLNPDPKPEQKPGNAASNSSPTTN